MKFYCWLFGHVWYMKLWTGAYIPLEWGDGTRKQPLKQFKTIRNDICPRCKETIKWAF